MIAKKTAVSDPIDGPRRALGIDFGEKRIGLAISDPEGRWAMPLATLERQTDRRAAHQIADLARREGIELLVLGEPLGLDGEAGEAALRVRRFGQRLVKITSLPLRFIDEALTTVEAAERLDAAGLDRPGPQRQNPNRRDEVAAQILLQEALDRFGIPDRRHGAGATTPEPVG